MIKSLFVPLQRLREEVRQLKQSVEAVTNASPEKLVEQILAYASRPLTEFNKYEVLEMLETLHNKAADRNHDRKNYYRLVHQSAREKVELSKDHFKGLVMRLLGDKDHERVWISFLKYKRSQIARSLKRTTTGVLVWHGRLVYFLCDVIFVIGEVISKLIVLI